MRLKKHLLIIMSVAALLSCGCGRVSLTATTDAPTTTPAARSQAFDTQGFVPLVQLIATPERFHGKSVMVVGYLKLEFEGDSLYLHQEDATHHTSNSLWIALTPEDRKKYQDLSGRYVVVDAIFDATLHGHMSVSVATLRNIRSCEVWFDAKP